MLTKLYVGNFSQQVTVKDLRGLFSRTGKVVSVDLIKDPQTGQSKGFAFVEMRSTNEADTALHQLDGYQLKQQALKVVAVELARKYHNPRSKPVLSLR